MKPQPEKPVLKVKPHSYQPSKVELEADMSIDATPEEVLRKLGQQVVVQADLLPGKKCSLRHDRKIPLSPPFAKGEA